MQEIPIHPSQTGDLKPRLSHRRDLLLRAGQGNPQALREASRALEFECVSETLRLTGVPVSSEEAARVARGEAPVPGRVDLIRGNIEALRTMERAAQSGSTLTVSLIREVHRLASPPSGGALRAGPARIQFVGATPSRAETVPPQLDNLIEWLGAKSVSGLQMPGKAALAFVRLLEISPFESGNFRAAHLLLSFFAFQEGYLPLFLRLDEAEEIREDVERAMRFDTLPLTSRLARAQARVLDFCLETVGRRDL